MTEPNGGAGSGTDERGYPEGTPVADMTPEQQAAYWKYHARKHENTARSFEGGLSAADAKALQDKLAALEAEKLSADERALQEAQRQAAEAARVEAEQVWVPKLHRAQVKAVASTRLDDESLGLFLEGTNLGAFVGEDGEIDSAKLTKYLDAFKGPTVPGKFHAEKIGTPRPQHSAPGAGGRAEAEKRFGKKTTTTS